MGRPRRLRAPLGDGGPSRPFRAPGVRLWRPDHGGLGATRLHRALQAARGRVLRRQLHDAGRHRWRRVSGLQNVPRHDVSIIDAMRLRTAFCGLVAATTPAWGVDWRPLPSPAQYQATVDLDSVIAQKGVMRFIVRRAYASAQSHASGKEYLSTRPLYLADCNARTPALVVTQYYGQDRNLIQAAARPEVKRSEPTTP